MAVSHLLFGLSPVPKPLNGDRGDVRQPFLAMGACFPVNHTVRQASHAFGNGRELTAPVPRPQAHPVPVLPGHDLVAVVLYLLRAMARENAKSMQAT
jgi:hypothetical protein